MMHDAFIGLSTNRVARGLATGFPLTRRVARRFIAGETLDEAVAVVKKLNARGIKGLMNEVGESVSSQTEASQAAENFKILLHRIADEKLDSTISLKPSHIGLGFGPDFFYENVADIVQVAQSLGNTVEVDMEESADVETTLSVYHRLLDTFGGNLRLAIQAYLYRTQSDIEPLLERGTSIRVVKGAYSAPPDVAYQSKKEINQAMIDLMESLLAPAALEKGVYLALGSHDPKLIEWLIQETERRNINKDDFEIQMLQGIRRDEQLRLAKLGYSMRVYVPYGSAWYPYFMRRLAERPANVFFITRAFFGK